MRNISVKLFEFGSVVQDDLELWRPFCSSQRNHLFNFGRRHYEEHLCEIILNLDQWFRRGCRLKTFLN